MGTVEPFNVFRIQREKSCSSWLSLSIFLFEVFILSLFIKKSHHLQLLSQKCHQSLCKNWSDTSCLQAWKYMSIQASSQWRPDMSFPLQVLLFLPRYKPGAPLMWRKQRVAFAYRLTIKRITVEKAAETETGCGCNLLWVDLFWAVGLHINGDSIWCVKCSRVRSVTLITDSRSEGTSVSAGHWKHGHFGVFIQGLP